MDLAIFFAGLDGLPYIVLWFAYLESERKYISHLHYAQK